MKRLQPSGPDIEQPENMRNSFKEHFTNPPIGLLSVIGALSMFRICFPGSVPESGGQLMRINQDLNSLVQLLSLGMKVFNSSVLKGLLLLLLLQMSVVVRIKQQACHGWADKRALTFNVQANRVELSHSNVAG